MNRTRDNNNLDDQYYYDEDSSSEDESPRNPLIDQPSRWYRYDEFGQRVNFPGTRRTDRYDREQTDIHREYITSILDNTFLESNVGWGDNQIDNRRLFRVVDDSITAIRQYEPPFRERLREIRLNLVHATEAYQGDDYEHENFVLARDALRQFLFMAYDDPENRYIQNAKQHYQYPEDFNESDINNDHADFFDDY